ncbi:MAG: phenylalanine--tRNA ligase subunit alpha [Candidatus Nezhaarchaeota archaeon]|nr:phenylalanine--tRNA ligase subunit alpha [Candidatus Nezhaarchaeota archaeon]
MVGLRLSNMELRVLRALKKVGGEATASQLASLEQLDKNALMSALERLASKNLIKLEKIRDELLALTPEGLNYAAQGLPERRLYEASIPSASLSEVKSKLGMSDNAFSIALGWAKRKGWVEVRNGIVKALKAPEVDDDELALRRLLELSSATTSDLCDLGECVERLKKRSLVIAKPLIEVRAKLTSEGLAAVEKAESLVEISVLTPEIVRSRAWATIRLKPYDVAAEPYVTHPGKKHFYLNFLDEIREVLVSMGFIEHEGPLVETEFWNFDALFQAQDHPAREIHDSFHVKKPSDGWIEDEELAERVRRVHEDGWTTGSRGWGYRWSYQVAKRLVLRTQTTAVSVRYLSKHPKPPVRMFCLSRVYRPDVLDAKHSMEFMQLDGVYGDHGVTLRHLLGIIEELASALKLGLVRFKPGYFPFTEPSVEGFVKHPTLGWIEFVGSGMFRPEVLKPLGVDYPVAAWGIGVDRLAMVILGVHDIRDLYTYRLEWLRARPLPWREA